jgi:hypothetical protein
MIIAIIHSRSAQSADDAVDPHWNKTTCQSCHIEADPTAGNLQFQQSDVETICESCHSSRGGAISCRHNSDIPVGDIAALEGHTSFLKDGNIVCTTCHDLTLQCLNPSRSYSYVNPTLLRDKKSRNGADYCYQCHEESNYEKLNPHQGVAGDPPKATGRGQRIVQHSARPERYLPRLPQRAATPDRHVLWRARRGLGTPGKAVG